jgi:hypothetical protein
MLKTFGQSTLCLHFWATILTRSQVLKPLLTIPDFVRHDRYLQGDPPGRVYILLGDQMLAANQEVF